MRPTHRRKPWKRPKLASRPLYSGSLQASSPAAGAAPTADDAPHNAAPQHEVARLREEVASLQSALRWHEKFLQTVIDAVPGFVCVKELEGRFAVANRTLAEAYGTSTADLVGRSDHDFNPDPAQVAGFIEDDRQVIVGRATIHVHDERFTTHDGEFRWLRTTKVPLVEEDGSCSRLLAVALDVTRQHQLEQELLELKQTRTATAAHRDRGAAPGRRSRTATVAVRGS